jgi:hypothetical protein
MWQGIVEWLIAWVMVATVLYIVVDVGQRYIYEERVELLLWRVLAVSPVLAAALVLYQVPFEDLLYTAALPSQGVFWFLACWLAFRFQLGHAAGVGFLTAVLVCPLVWSTLYTLRPVLFSASSLGPGTETISP